MQQKHHLPIEILQTIFEFSPPNFSAISNVYPPILVCKTWSSVATSTRSLWCEIHIDCYLLGLMGTRERLELWIRRSGEVRHLHISIPRVYKKGRRSFGGWQAASLNIQTLAQSGGRWKSLRFAVHTPKLLDMMITAITKAKNIQLDS
jgi:hypothetical protein